ncbi:MAG: cysteine-rich CWC family protein [Burkholderiales bacterium]
MPDHENKHCPRCGNGFECKAGSVLICQCSAVDLSAEEQAYVRCQFDDCLCVSLRELKAQSAMNGVRTGVR